MGTEGFGPKIVFTIPGLDIPITETVTNTWIIMALLILFAYVAGRNLKRVPKGMQLITETIVGGVNGLTRQTMGDNKMGFAPYIGTLMLFIGISNIAGLFTLRPPTADVNTTMGLALMTFFAIQGFGIRSHGVVGHFKGFLQPMAFLLPLNILGELANPISLAFRLFGNIIGGVIVMSLLYSALSGLSASAFGLIGLNVGIPIFQVIAAPLHIYFDLFSGLLQSFIFSMLTMVFISNAMD